MEQASKLALASKPPRLMKAGGLEAPCPSPLPSPSLSTVEAGTKRKRKRSSPAKVPAVPVSSEAVWPRGAPQPPPSGAQVDLKASTLSAVSVPQGQSGIICALTILLMRRAIFPA